MILVYMVDHVKYFTNIGFYLISIDKQFSWDFDGKRLKILEIL